MILLYRLFPVFFFVINKISVWAIDSPHFDEKIVLLSGKNDKSELETLDGKTMKRVQRDVGISGIPLVNAFVTGIIGHEKRHVRVKKDTEPAIEAVLHDIIGMTSKTASGLINYHPHPSGGGCDWFGTGPFCMGECPLEYDYIRSSNGRCSNWWLAGICKPDPSFGVPCSTIFGGFFKKRFCCKSDSSDCTWSGRWMGAFTAHNIYCRYDNHGNCGRLKCSVNHFNYKDQDSSEINGVHCDRISLFGLRGEATCGFIVWYNDKGTRVESWYKSK